MSQNHPLVSLILPIRNEARYIKRCLNAVLAQDYPLDRLEILIADGMSTDGTREIVSKLAASNSQTRSSVPCFPSLTVLDKPGKIVPTGLNVALRQSECEINVPRAFENASVFFLSLCLLVIKGEEFVV